MKNSEMLPVGVRRDGSYYTRVLWADITESDPTFWVNNLINDDLGRNGGTWGANTESTANCVLDFFGETQTVSRIAFYKNVGISISVLEELARAINIYVSPVDSASALRRREDSVDSVKWQRIARVDTVMEEGWQEVVLDRPVEAGCVRIELDHNFCRPGDGFIPWVEMNEIKLYP